MYSARSQTTAYSALAACRRMSRDRHCSLRLQGHPDARRPGQATDGRALGWRRCSGIARICSTASADKALAPPPEPARAVRRSGHELAPARATTRATRRAADWDIKLGPEAQVEVVVSRLLWAVGFHQPPTYYVPRWTLAGGPRPGPQDGGRFGPPRDDCGAIGRWAWDRNPFVGTREMRGLFVMMVIVSNWDFKTSQNAVYESVAVRHAASPVHRAGSRRVARPHAMVDSRSRGDVDGFTSERFIAGVREGLVDFHYRGAWRYPHLDNDVTPDDVRWICGLLSRLSERQWQDAFRAAGYEPSVASRYIEHLRARAHEGASLTADRPVTAIAADRRPRRRELTCVICSPPACRAPGACAWRSRLGAAVIRVGSRREDRAADLAAQLGQFA